MRVLESGSGDPLVLLHPFPLNATYWAPQLGEPPRGWRLLAPDFRGFGRDAAKDAPAQSLDDYARDVIALLDWRGIPRAVIGGVSLGGYVALAMARLAPERVRALVLANTRMDADPPGNRADRLTMIDLIAREGSAGLARDMPKLLGATTEWERPELKRALAVIIAATPAAGITAAVRAIMTRPDATAVASSFSRPVLLVSGDEDALTPPPLQRAMQQVMPHAALETIPGAGHLASLERPGEFNLVLQRFLHTLDR